MARFNRRKSLVPIVSNKEVIDGVFLIVTGGVTTDIKIASAINNHIGTVGTMTTNSVIKGFYLETSYNNVDNIIGRLDWYLCKVPGAGDVITAYPSPGATGGNVHRTRIFHERKGVAQGATDTIGGQVSKSIEFVAIPKKFQKMSEGDEWFIRVGSSENYSFCLKCIYKWYI